MKLNNRDMSYDEILNPFISEDVPEEDEGVDTPEEEEVEGGEETTSGDESEDGEI